MDIQIFDDKLAMGAAAAAYGAETIRKRIQEAGSASIILATGASQFEMLSQLVKEPEIDWSKVSCFHLDEYVGLTIDHPASFRKYLKERFVDQLPTPPANFYFVNGETDPETECQRLGDLIAEVQIDVAFIGIGENGHLAFNDPPADFETTNPFIVVTLDEACRQQQFGEGWFDSLAAVPQTAISMSIHQIMQATQIVCTVPDLRKSTAVAKAVQGEKTNLVPASILQDHANTTLFLDKEAAAKLA